jgi:hypothetical protein
VCKNVPKRSGKIEKIIKKIVIVKMSSSEDAAHRAFLKRTMVKSAATKVDVG